MGCFPPKHKFHAFAPVRRIGSVNLPPPSPTHTRTHATQKRDTQGGCWSFFVSASSAFRIGLCAYTDVRMQARTHTHARNDIWIEFVRHVCECVFSVRARMKNAFTKRRGADCALLRCCCCRVCKCITAGWARARVMHVKSWRGHKVDFSRRTAISFGYLVRDRGPRAQTCGGRVHSRSSLRDCSSGHLAAMRVGVAF